MRVSCLALSIAAVWCLPQEVVPHRAAVAAYRGALLDVESHRPGASLETVYSLSARVEETLLARVRDDSLLSVLESLSASDVAALEAELPGLIVVRDEVVHVRPDPDYFLGLARRHGSPADRAFFEAYRRTRPEGGWPVYLRPQTDYSGCTEFGRGELVATYRLWTEFAHSFPGAYAAGADRFLADIEAEVADSTCACGDAPSVTRELERFAEAFPDSSASPLASERARAIKEQRSVIRFNCQSG